MKQLVREVLLLQKILSIDLLKTNKGLICIINVC
ncbi:hypothetical protein BHY_0461 [Borrelia nietonii YOR]|uniref:Variable outer membrane protein n=1 Tax=Borrelia nietonii YOR TaxID=1293576 RepID=A0ABN4C840_9SPIR|nr:hypothetical protein BHY_0461 [Borrelia nietonii YOR]